MKNLKSMIVCGITAPDSLACMGSPSKVNSMTVDSCNFLSALSGGSVVREFQLRVPTVYVQGLNFSIFIFFHKNKVFTVTFQTKKKHSKRANIR